MINPTKLFKIKGAMGAFTQSHPKFTNYLNAIRNNALEEGTIIDINVTTIDGKSLSSNIKLTKEDVELFRELSDLSNNV
jgi:hypothetical protein